MQRKAELPGGLRRVPAYGWLASAAMHVLVLAACCGLPTMAAAQSDLLSQPAASSSMAQTAPSPIDSPWNVLGRSVEDRVIEYRQFGSGPGEVLVVGPLDGDETAAIDLIEQLAEHLGRFPRRATGVKVTLVRDPNPDGRLRRSPANARGVRLDQNFPTRGWRKVPAGSSWLSGREPESEPEVRALVDLIGDLRPNRVIILAATRRQAELTYVGQAEPLAREFAKTSGLRPSSANAAALQGSLAVYTGVDRQVPTLVVRVPAAMRRDQLWATYKRALLATIGSEADDDEPGASSQMAKPREVLPGQGNTGIPPRGLAPLAVLAATKRMPPESAEATPPKGSTNAPRVLTAEELEFGGELVPIVRPPVTAKKQSDVARRSPPINAPRRQFGPAVPQVPYPVGRAQQRSGFPPATLMRPNPTAVNPMRPSMVPPREVTSPGLKMVERLPTVDPATSPPRTLPQPIPLYPATGY